MIEFAVLAVDSAIAAGARWAESRAVRTRRRRFSLVNGLPHDSLCESDAGMNVRASLETGAGFSALACPGRDIAHDVAARAVAAARAASVLTRQPVELAPHDVVDSVWTSPVATDPFEVPYADIAQLLRDIDAALRRPPQVVATRAAFHCEEVTSFFASSSGSRLTRTVVRTGISFAVTAASDSRTSTRSSAGALGTGGALAGWEHVLDQDPVSAAEELAEEALALLAAPSIAPRRLSLVLDPAALAWLLHVTAERALESDRSLDRDPGERPFPDPLAGPGSPFGAPQVRIRADGIGERGGTGSAPWDDEGTPCQAWDVVSDGVVRGLFSSRSTAIPCGESRSRGCARAAGWRVPPLARSPDLSLEPGDGGSLHDLLAPIDDGLLLGEPASWFIDPVARRFRVGFERAWRIAGGLRSELVRDVSLECGFGDIWNSVEAVADRSTWRSIAIRSDTRGCPAQSVPLSHGACAARTRPIEVTPIGSAEGP